MEDDDETSRFGLKLRRRVFPSPPTRLQDLNRPAALPQSAGNVTRKIVPSARLVVREVACSR